MRAVPCFAPLPFCLGIVLYASPAAAGETLVPGDVNCDAHVDISDAVTLLAYLYLGAGPPCPLADRPELLAQVVDLQGQVAQLEAERSAMEAELKLCKEKVAELERKLASPNLPATGETKCFDRDHEIDCSSADFPGQDGYYQTGYSSVDRFIDNGDGTVMDKRTGLMWQKETAPGSYDWGAALRYCDALNLAGHGDWRLPNVRELQSIVDYGGRYPTFDPVFGASTNWYWSSSTSPEGPDLAWTTTSWGGIDRLTKGYSNLVRAVRSGP